MQKSGNIKINGQTSKILNIKGFNANVQRDMQKLDMNVRTSALGIHKHLQQSRLDEQIVVKDEFKELTTDKKVR